MNQTIYLKVDSQNFVTDFKLIDADGFVAVVVPLAWVADLMKYPTKFSVVDGTLKAPGNLPSVSTDDLKKQLDAANQTITNQGEKISQQATTITQLQMIAGQLTAQVAKQNVAAATDTVTGKEE